MEWLKDLITWLFTDQRPPWKKQTGRKSKLLAEIGLTMTILPAIRWARDIILLRSISSEFAMLFMVFSPILVGFFAALTRRHFSVIGIVNSVNWVGRVAALHLSVLVLCSYFISSAHPTARQAGTTGQYGWPLWTAFDFWLVVSGAVILTVALWAWTASQRTKHGIWTVGLYASAIVVMRFGGLLVPGNPWWPTSLPPDEYFEGGYPLAVHSWV